MRWHSWPRDLPNCRAALLGPVPGPPAPACLRAHLGGQWFQAAYPSHPSSQTPVRTWLPHNAWLSWRPRCCPRPREHQALLLPCTQVPGRHASPHPEMLLPRPHWQRWLCGWAGAAAVASVVVISVSLCLVAACPPSLLVPVVQDLEVSGLLFSSSFPSSFPVTPQTPPSPGLAPAHPRLSWPCLTLLLLKPGRHACRLQAGGHAALC